MLISNDGSIGQNGSWISLLVRVMGEVGVMWTCMMLITCHASISTSHEYIYRNQKTENAITMIAPSTIVPLAR
jgi:hypothetical protein